MRVYEDENKSLRTEISKMDVKLQETADKLRNTQLANEELEFRLESVEIAAGESLGAELGEMAKQKTVAVVEDATIVNKALTSKLALVLSEVSWPHYQLTFSKFFMHLF